MRETERERERERVKEESGIGASAGHMAKTGKRERESESSSLKRRSDYMPTPPLLSLSSPSFTSVSHSCCSLSLSVFLCGK